MGGKFGKSGPAVISDSRRHAFPSGGNCCRKSASAVELCECTQRNADQAIFSPCPKLLAVDPIPYGARGDPVNVGHFAHRKMRLRSHGWFFALLVRHGRAIFVPTDGPLTMDRQHFGEGDLGWVRTSRAVSGLVPTQIYAGVGDHLARRRSCHRARRRSPPRTILRAVRRLVACSLGLSCVSGVSFLGALPLAAQLRCEGRLAIVRPPPPLIAPKSRATIRIRLQRQSRTPRHERRKMTGISMPIGARRCRSAVVGEIVDVAAPNPG